MGWFTTIGHTKLKCFSYFKLNLVTKWLLTKNNFVISTTYYTNLKTIPTVPLTQHQSSCLWWQTKCFCSAYFTLLHCMEYYFVIFIWIVGWFFQRNKWKGSLDRGEEEKVVLGNWDHVNGTSVFTHSGRGCHARDLFEHMKLLRPNSKTIVCLSNFQNG